MRKFILCSVLFVGVMAASSAQAAILVNHPDQLFFTNQITSLKMVNYENAYGLVNGQIVQGSRLRGIFTITSSWGDLLGSGSANQRVPGPFELTGIFDTTVLTAPVPSGAEFLFEFGPTAGFGASLGLTGAAASGAMVAFYHDTTPDFTEFGTIASTEASATDGALYMVLGADGTQTWGTDYYWSAIGSVTPNVATFAASLALLVNNSGIATGEFGEVTQFPSLGFPPALAAMLNTFGLQGNVRGNTAGSGSPYLLESNDPLRAKALPEPASIGVWLLLSAVGGSFVIRRRRRA